MAVKLPNVLERREILYGQNTPKHTLVEYGMAYEERARLDDAVQFYVQAGDEAGLGRIKAKAMDIGDAFLLKAVAKAAPKMVSGDDWRALIENAERLGKNLYADQARAALKGSLEALEPAEKRGRVEASGRRKTDGSRRQEDRREG